MPHRDVIIDGRREPSVTQLSGLLKTGDWLLTYYAKHGTLKLNALREAISVSEADALTKIPDSFFEENRLNREDFWKDADTLKNVAKDRGVGLHNVFEEAAKAWMTGATPPDNDFVKALDFWLKGHGFTFKAYEKFVQSDKHKYGGTFDALVADASGNEVIVDWKFTNRMHSDYVLQLAGYDIALGGKPRPGYILRISESAKPAKVSKEGATKAGKTYQFEGSKVKLEEHFVPDLGKYHHLFLYCRELFDFVRGYPL
jgi:hypothetical protein